MAGRLQHGQAAVLFDDDFKTPSPSELLSWLLGQRPQERRVASAARPVIARPLSPSQAMAAAPARRPGGGAATRERTPPPTVAGDPRRAPRAPLGVAGGLTRAGFGAILPARTVDVSKTGAHVFTLANLEQMERVQHLLRFPGDSQSLPIAAKVVWRKTSGRGFDAGLCYEQASLGEAVERLTEWIENRWADVRQLQFLLALERRAPAQQRLADELTKRLGAPADPSAAREWLAKTAASFRHAP